MNINIDTLTCGKCGNRIDIEWMQHDSSNKEYWDAVKAGIIDPMENDYVTIFYAVCDDCGVTNICYSYEDAVKAAIDGKFKPWKD